MNTEHTIDPTPVTSNSEQLAVLKQHFPHCFDKNGQFVLSRFEEVLQAHEVATTQESYKLDWLGKSYARLLANEPIRTLLSADVAHNSQAANLNSQNLLIQGDNLEVLKHLKGAYREAVKMIYIDPPYNTGSDGFVYQDDRKFTPEQLADLANVSLEEAKRILDFTQRGANSHSAWLTFMYPRLYVAKQLLRDDGVIFISIDDNEQAQLKLLCDEVFGEANFVDCIVWQKTFAPKNDAKFFSGEHEYILIYAKNKNCFSLNLLERGEKQNARYSNPDNDPRGAWISTDLLRMEHRENSIYEIISPTGKVWKPVQGTSWRHPETEMLELINNGEVIFGKDGNAKPRRKRFLKDVKQGTISQTIWKHDEVSHTQEAKQSLNKLLEGFTVFDTPKPIKLLIRMLDLSSNTETHDVILDFFAGSGTTAHAVMQLNAEDGGNRQFICVQLDEKTDPKKEAHKAGYKSIFNITQARIQKAAQKIQTEHPNYTGDLGFKQFKTVPIFEHYQQPIAQFDPNLNLFDGTQLSPQDLANLLTTWQLQHNIPLSQTLNTIDLDGYIAHWFNDTLYLMAQGFDSPHLKAFIQKLDTDNSFTITKLIMFGYNINSKMQREIDEGLKNYRNKKSITLDVVVKY